MNIHRRIGISQVNAELSASMEDYLEAIYHLVKDGKVARSKDISEALNVAKPSVTGALKILSEKGLVNYKPYGYVTLKASGKKEAARIVKKHNAIRSFFEDVLGVESEIASEAACRAEHSLGPKIISRLISFNEFVQKNAGEKSAIAENFHKHYSKEPGT